MSNDEQNEFFFNFGDLVRTDGYWPRVFRVDGYRSEHWQYPNEQWTDLVYELTDAHTGEFIEADVEDLTLVETADKADAYLAEHPAPANSPAPIKPEWMTIMFGGDETMKNFGEKPKEPRKPTARELSAQLANEQKEMRKRRGEQIDNLLDIRNWAANLLAKTGNETFGDRVVAIDCELKKMTEIDEK